MCRSEYVCERIDKKEIGLWMADLILLFKSSLLCHHKIDLLTNLPKYLIEIIQGNFSVPQCFVLVDLTI